MKLPDICTLKQWKTISKKELGIIGYYDRFNHDKPTLMIGCRGTCGQIHLSEGKAYINGNAMCLDNLSPDFDTNYVRFFLEHYDFSKIITGTAQPQITQEGLKKVLIEKIPLNEQKNISSQLTKIKNLIKDEKQCILSFDSLIKSRFNEMFGDPIDNIHKFDLDYLKNLGFLSRGKSKHRPRNDPQLLGGPYPLIQTGDVKNAGLYIKHYDSTYSEFGLLQSKLWPKGTLCITIAANIAETAILDFDACFPDSIVGFLPNKRANTIFIRYKIEALKYVLNSKATEVAQKNLNLEKLESVFFMVPPIILQNEFASLVEQVDKLKFNCQQRIKLYQELLDKKMDEYFS